MKKGKRIISLLLAAGLLATTLAGCSGGSSASKGSSSGSAKPTDYRMLYSSEVSTMNYLVTSTTNDLVIPANTVDCLIEFDKYGVIKPALAESWETSSDGLTWTFHIRKGVKWVDNTGKEVADVKAQDWVDAAKYVLDAQNSSSSEYMYEGIVKNAAEYYAYSDYMLQSKNGTRKVDDDGNALTPVDKVDFNDVGVKATDDYTLVYTLAKPTPYFLTVLTYGCYMPVNGAFLEKEGSNFGTDATSLLYCGSYYLSSFAAQTSHVMTKNPTYWDKGNVFIDTITQTYNAQAETLEPEMFKRGEIDEADISSDILKDWQSSSGTKDLVRPQRVDNSYSYFYAFNFDPKFDAKYEPDNWKKAVNNEDFRQAMMAALNRTNPAAIMDPNDPKSILNNTVTPSNFCSVNGVDYTQLSALKARTDGDTFNETKAKEYRDKAKTELAAEGVTFPIKVLMPFNPSTTNWDKECQVVEQQMENVLGKDFIDVIVEAGPSTGFLSAVRRSGKYAFMKVNWGCDYADPQTWTDPFKTKNNYNFMDKSTDPNTKKTVTEYYSMVAAAKAETSDLTKRYNDFAAAEEYLLDHAIVIPYSVDVSNYIANYLNPFEGEYAPYGLSQKRYKGQHLLSKPMSTEEFNAGLKQWEADRTKALAASASSK